MKDIYIWPLIFVFLVFVNYISWKLDIRGDGLFGLTGWLGRNIDALLF